MKAVHVYLSRFQMMISTHSNILHDTRTIHVSKLPLIMAPPRRRRVGNPIPDPVASKADEPSYPVPPEAGRRSPPKRRSARLQRGLIPDPVAQYTPPQNEPAPVPTLGPGHDEDPFVHENDLIAIPEGAGVFDQPLSLVGSDDEVEMHMDVDLALVLPDQPNDREQTPNDENSPIQEREESIGRIPDEEIASEREAARGSYASSSDNEDLMPHEEAYSDPFDTFEDAESFSDNEPEESNDGRGPGSDRDGVSPRPPIRERYNLDNDEELVEAFDAFQYGVLPYFTKDDLLRIALYKIKSDGNVSLSVHQLYCDIVACFTQDGKSQDRRTVEACLDRLTGIHQTRYDACAKGCSAFTEDDTDSDSSDSDNDRDPESDNHHNFCSICAAPRKRAPGKRPTFDYVDLIHRLKLWYSEPLRAAELKGYVKSLDRERADPDNDDNSKRDIWDGKLIRTLREKGMLDRETDLAFTFSTDGVQLFRKGKSHTIFPMMLVCLNLSPEIRFLQDNIILLGIMPGPDKPKDIDSYLRPMINEFKSLEQGVPGVLDASSPTRSKFTLRAYIVAVTADMPARDDLMGLMGYSATHYCNYCNIQGVFKNHVYCPLTPPTDAFPGQGARPWKHYAVDPAQGVQASQRGRGRGSSQARGQSQSSTSSGRARGRGRGAGRGDAGRNGLPVPEPLPMRTHMGMDVDSSRVEAGNAELGSLTGTKRRSIFFELNSIIFPWSFPIDAMHLFYLNVAKHMRDHWRGNYFNWETRNPTGEKRSKTRESKFRDTKEPYCIPKHKWHDMDDDLKNIKIPTAFGNKIRGVFEFRKANEWKTWVKVRIVDSRSDASTRDASARSY